MKSFRLKMSLGFALKQPEFDNRLLFNRFYWSTIITVLLIRCFEIFGIDLQRIFMFWRACVGQTNFFSCTSSDNSLPPYQMARESISAALRVSIRRKLNFWNQVRFFPFVPLEGGRRGGGFTHLMSRSPETPAAFVDKGIVSFKLLSENYLTDSESL